MRFLRCVWLAGVVVVLVLGAATAGMAMPEDGVAGQVSACPAGGAPDWRVQSSRGWAAAKPDQPLDISMRVLGPAALGQCVGVEVTVTPLINAPQLDLRVVVPPDVAVPAATSVWQASVNAGASLTRSVQVQLRSEGLFELRADARIPVEGGVFAKSAVLFLDVREEGCTVLAERPIPPPAHEELARQVAGPASAPPGPPVEVTGGFRVYGCFLYSDRPYDTNGFTGARVTRPIRCAIIQVYDEEPLKDELLATTHTDCNGYFQAWVRNNDDGPGQGGRDIYVTCYATNGCTVAVTGIMYDTVWALRTETRSNHTGGDMCFGARIPASDGFDAVFNIMDTIHSGCQWASGQAGQIPATVQCRWEPGNEDGTHYHPDDHLIDLLDKANDPDQFDDDVILHEYGHHLAHIYSYDKSPCGTHSWSADYDTYYRTRPDDDGGPLSLLEAQQLCWSEGWATYASSAIRDSPTYVDNTGFTPGWANDLDLEAPTSNVTGDDCEGAVAATLWDIYDSNSDVADTLSLGPEEIWGVFDGYFDDSRDCTLRTFWDGWIGYGYDELWGLWAIFDEHGVNYIAQPVHAEFTADVTLGGAPLLVQFTDLSINNPTSWSWDFGDGTGSTDQNPSHEYNQVRTYPVTLTVSNGSSSDTETKEHYIVVPFVDTVYVVEVLPIMACFEAGIASGYEDGTYRPADPVDRASMAVYVSRAIVGGDEYVPTGPATATFDDVPTNHWAYKYVEYAVAAKVVHGYGPTIYAPAALVDRGQMAVFIARALVVPRGDAGVPEGPPVPTFPDMTPTGAYAWCYKHVEYLAAEGVVGGYPDGTYRPATVVTRAQMAVYVQRAFELPM